MIILKKEITNQGILYTLALIEAHIAKYDLGRLLLLSLLKLSAPSNSPLYNFAILRIFKLKLNKTYIIFA